MLRLTPLSTTTPLALDLPGEECLVLRELKAQQLAHYIPRRVQGGGTVIIRAAWASMGQVVPPVLAVGTQLQPVCAARTPGILKLLFKICCLLLEDGMLHILINASINVIANTQHLSSGEVDDSLGDSG